MPFLIVLAIVIIGLIFGWQGIGVVVGFIVAVIVAFGIWLIMQFSKQKRRRHYLNHRTNAEILEDIKRNWDREDEQRGI